MQKITDGIAGLLFQRNLDYAFRTIFTVVVTLLFTGLLISAIALWPIIWQLSGSDSALAVNCTDLIRAGLGLGGFALLYGLAVPDARYGFVKTLLTTYVIDICVIFTVMWLRPIAIAGIDSGDAFFALLRAVGQFFVSITFGLLPALVSACLSWLIREVFTAVTSA